MNTIPREATMRPARMRHAATILRDFRRGVSLRDIELTWWYPGGFYTHDQIINVIRRALIRAERRRKNGIGRRR